MTGSRVYAIDAWLKRLREQAFVMMTGFGGLRSLLFGVSVCPGIPIYGNPHMSYSRFMTFWMLFFRTFVLRPQMAYPPFVVVKNQPVCQGLGAVIFWNIKPCCLQFSCLMWVFALHICLQVEYRLKEDFEAWCCSWGFWQSQVRALDLERNHYEPLVFADDRRSN